MLISGKMPGCKLTNTNSLADARSWLDSLTLSTRTDSLFADYTDLYLDMQEDTLSWMQLDSLQVLRLEQLSREESIIQNYALAARSLRGDTVYHRYPDLESTTSPRLGSIKVTPKIPENKDTVRIYPNPNFGTFTLELNLSKEEQVTWCIFDLTGRRLKSGSLSGSKQVRSSLEITDLVDGLYLFELRGADNAVIDVLRITLTR